MQMLKKIERINVESVPKHINMYACKDHGVMLETDYRGIGINMLHFHTAITGTGDDVKTAYADAVQQLHAVGYDIEELAVAIDLELADAPDTRYLKVNDDEYYYVSILVK